MKQAKKTKQGPLSLLLLLIALVLLFVAPRPAAAQAGSLLIWPVDPVIESDARATALWLENPGKAPITLQVRIYAWAQDGGKNAYAPQQIILGTPPIVTVAPGAKQLIRLTRTAPTPARTEQAFRVVVDEIPTSSPATESGAAVSFRMRYSLPLFVYGDGLTLKGTAKAKTATPSPKLAWRLTGIAGKQFLEVRNMGNVHARLTDVAFAQGGTSETDIALAKGLFGYVLPGATMRWPLPAGTAAGAELVAAVNGAARTRLERMAD